MRISRQPGCSVVANANIKAELTARVARLRERGIAPGLATVLVGDDPASHSYVRMKHRDCDDVGIASIRVELPAAASLDLWLRALLDT